MRTKWPKLASLAQKNAHSGFSSLMHALLSKDTLLRTSYRDTIVYYIPINDTSFELSIFWPSDTESQINETEVF